MSQPVSGQSATGQDPQSGATGGTGTGDGGTGDGSQGGTGQSQEQAPGTDSGQSATVTKAEFDALMARMRAADQRASKAEADLKQLVDKDLPELEKLRRDLADAQKVQTETAAALVETRISNAFLSDTTFKWKNPASALRLLDRDKIEIDDKGNVTGMKDAVTALSKSDPYLVDDSKPGDDDAGAGAGGTGHQLGTPPANSGGTGGTGPSKTDQAKRFSALRSRVG